VHYAVTSALFPNLIALRSGDGGCLKTPRSLVEYPKHFRHSLPAKHERKSRHFEGYEIRRHFDEQTGTWWFSVVDIIRVLTQQPDYKATQNYWKVLKHRLSKEGSQLVTKCNQLKMTAADGKR
jgi:hypothetical protein